MAVYAGQWGSFSGMNGTARVQSSASATSVSWQCLFSFQGSTIAKYLDFLGGGGGERLVATYKMYGIMLLWLIYSWLLRGLTIAPFTRAKLV